MEAVKKERHSQKGRASLAKLLLLYVAGFVVPLIFFYLLIGYFKGPDLSEDPASEPVTNGDQRSYLIRGFGDYIRISDGPDVEPYGGKDFVFLLTFKLLELPESGKKEFIAIKYDRDSSEHQGFSLAFQNESDGVRPLVYWRNTEGEGRWYSFAPAPILEKEWYAIAISFLDEHYLGVHLMNVDSAKASTKVLGGYRFDQPIFPVSDSDLFIGGVQKDSNLKARLGGLAIWQKRGISQQLDGIFDQVRFDPVRGQLNQDDFKDTSFFIADFSESASERVMLFKSGKLKRGGNG